MLDTSDWSDHTWWESAIDTAINTSVPVVCNLRITQTHYELSKALSAVTGPDTGANFHTWAVWGSKKAGKTIRREDIPFVTPVSYTHLTLPTKSDECRSRWSPYH